MKPPVPLAELRGILVDGEPLPFRVVDNLGRLLLALGQRIHGERQFAALIERGACVDHAEAAAVRQARGFIAENDTTAGRARSMTWFDALEQQVWLLDDLLRKLPAAAGANDWPAQFEAFTDAHIALVERHLDAALFVCVRQQDRRFALYALTHALHSATVVLLATRQLGWPAERERIAVRAALTMNASTLELQARMAEQVDPPSKKQMDLIRAHPLQSAQMLRDAGVTDADWLDAVEQHHERSGAGGYPRALAEPGEIAHVLRAADVFTAKITPRALRPALLPQAAARQLFQEEKGGAIATALIRAVGVYPPGEFVRLKNGETAIVIQRATAAEAAVVVSLNSATGKALAGTPRRDTRLPEYVIAGPLQERNSLPRILPEQVYGLLD
ncbi:Phosphohydrolase [Rubrivivax sp. A210]|uniref:HD-GYP domain-containing protein n=1 Tax=Rubrivivax sp. A210 TaxID=2772301 RepID=UPI00191A887C|nr:HD domain-containing phosphohydrolase [Rubrivivax sp. A210]CAD5372678.1 Phosphohydrolase [Rubrivivax sp. A210]